MGNPNSQIIRSHTHKLQSYLCNANLLTSFEIWLIWKKINCEINFELTGTTCTYKPVHDGDEVDAVRFVRLLFLGYVAVTGRQVPQRQHRLRRRHRRHRRELLLLQVGRQELRRRHLGYFRWSLPVVSYTSSSVFHSSFYFRFRGRFRYASTFLFCEKLFRFWTLCVCVVEKEKLFDTIIYTCTVLTVPEFPSMNLKKKPEVFEMSRLGNTWSRRRVNSGRFRIWRFQLPTHCNDRT